MSIHCAGLTCENKVKEAGQFCSSCWPGPDVPANPRQLRLDICHAGYKLAFGTKKESAEAQKKIINVLNHETTETTKEK
jgi:hypothetical protein